MLLQYKVDRLLYLLFGNIVVYPELGYTKDAHGETCTRACGYGFGNKKNSFNVTLIITHPHPHPQDNIVTSENDWNGFFLNVG
jgi:hypothetical protein